MGSNIAAIEYAFPDNLISNDDLRIKFPNFNFDSFEKRVGIKNRYWLNTNETALDIAVLACEKLFKKIDKNEIDFILYCTQSPEYILPTTACILQDRLNIPKTTGALDFNLGCSGYTSGLSMAKAFIETNQAKNVLLVTAESYSKYLHSKDRSNQLIFGDAATASLVSYSKDSKINNFLFGTDGSGYDKLIIKNGGSKHTFDFEAPTLSYGTDNFYNENCLYMNGPEIFKFAASKIKDFTYSILEKSNMNIGDIDQFIFHQANSFLLDTIRKSLKIEKSKFYINMMNYGNTVSSTIPIALKDYTMNKEPGEKTVLIIGFGVGLSWSGGIIKINKL